MGSVTRKIDRELFRRDVSSGKVTGGFFGTTSKHDPIKEKEEEAARLFKAKQVAAQAEASRVAKAAAAKIAADKKKADEEATKKATLLAKRRRGTSPYTTMGGAMGLLGQAPVQLKTLLGQ